MLDIIWSGQLVFSLIKNHKLKTRFLLRTSFEPKTGLKCTSNRSQFCGIWLSTCLKEINPSPLSLSLTLVFIINSQIFLWACHQALKPQRQFWCSTFFFYINDNVELQISTVNNASRSYCLLQLPLHHHHIQHNSFSWVK